MLSPDTRLKSCRVAVGVRQWGTFDPDTQRVQVMSEAEGEAEDLLDFAALHTFLQGGRVYAVAPDDVPDGGAVIAAVLRY